MLNISMSQIGEMELCPLNSCGYTNTIKSIIDGVRDTEKTDVYTSDGILFFYVSERYVTEIIRKLSIIDVEFIVHYEYGDHGAFKFRVNNYKNT